MKIDKTQIILDFKFPIGTKVFKPKGYKFKGVVVAAFITLAGKERYVVDNYDGMLHIFSEEQLEQEISV